MPMWLKVLVLVSLFYGAMVAAAYLMQTQALFPTASVPAAAPPPPAAERLEIMARSGHPLRGLHIPAAVRGTDRLVILGFGGNAWNADDAAMYLHDLYPAADIIVFHYRGYAPSGGHPSIAALVADAPLVFDFVRGRFDDAPIVAVGFSIGSGIVASLASRRPLAGAILVTPFDSLAALASAHYRWLPMRLLLRHQLDATAELRGVRTPIAIIAGERDRLIPAARTEALRRTVPNLVFTRIIAGAGHNDLYQNPMFHEAMRDALEQVRPAGG
jgi:fermentation-respiration switch protein FrsA (DUF1100 family)